MKLISAVIVILIFNLYFVQAYVPTGGATINYDNSMSEDEKDCQNFGCFLDGKCYPYGYVKNDMYCADEAIIRYPDGRPRMTEQDIFVSQKNESSECTNDFECLTDNYEEGICKNQTEEVKNVETPKEELTINSEDKNSSANLETEKEVVEKSFIERLFSWIGNIFG